MAERVDIAALKERVRLSDYVGKRVKLARSGADLFGLCPFHAEHGPSFSVNDRKGFFHCFGCGAHGDVVDWWRQVEGLSLNEAIDRLRREAGEPGDHSAHNAARNELDQEARRKQAEALAIWRASTPIGGTAAETYLREARGIGIPLPDCLRFHPALRVDPREAAEFPAMVAAVTDLSGDVVAIQRTFLRPGGSGKAQIDRPKRALGPVGRGCVRLAPASRIVGLAEGIETGLSAQELFCLPVWCALGSNLARIVLPASVREVALFADRGAAGESAARAAANVFRDQHRKVAIRYAREGKDFNDELKARRRGR
jgi:DNA primase